MTFQSCYLRTRLTMTCLQCLSVKTNDALLNDAYPIIMAFIHNLTSRCILIWSPFVNVQFQVEGKKWINNSLKAFFVCVCVWVCACVSVSQSVVIFFVCVCVFVFSLKIA